MKKHGFTLAEVLVTLGIIGVVAALTTPALVQNVGNAKVGPKLQKAKATFETACEMMMNENNYNTLLSEVVIWAGGYSGANPNGDKKACSDNYCTDIIGKKLQKYMKITKNDTGYTMYNYSGAALGANGNNYRFYDSDDGMTYGIWVWDNAPIHPDGVNIKYPDTPNHQKIGSVFVDINGSTKPNKVATDVFTFYLYNDGTLRPQGSSYYADGATGSSYGAWYEEGHYCDAEHGVSTGGECAGSIFENGLKIIYR